jgi:hypothetical protein
MVYPTVWRGGLGGLPFSVVPLSVVRHWSGPGIYLFEVSDSRACEVLYVGQSSDLATRLRPGHEPLEKATARGMTAVLVHLGPDDDAERIGLETRLRGIFDPPLNKQGSPIADALMELSNRTARPSGAFGEEPKGLGIGFLGAFGEQPKGLGIGLLGAFDNTPRRR